MDNNEVVALAEESNMDLTHHIAALIDYAGIHGNLTLVRATDEEKYYDEAEWEGSVAALFFTNTLQEMTPIGAVWLGDDGTFHILTGEDGSGDIQQEFTIREVLLATAGGIKLHWGE